MDHRQTPMSFRKDQASQGSIAFFLLFLLFVFIISLIAIRAIRIQRRPISETTEKRSPTATQTRGLTCPRTTPYPNPPEIDSAMRMVFNRIGAKLDKDHMGEGVTTIPENWMNCINASYKNLPTGVEGAFIFDKNSSVDNLQVFVDVGYKQYDDLLRATLLSHELRHVLQFLEYKASGKEAGCVDAEVAAFQTQFIFFLSLSESERLSLRDSTKKHLTSEPYAPVVSMYETYASARRTCGKAGISCIRNTITQSIRASVIGNPYYQKQCNI